MQIKFYEIDDNFIQEYKTWAYTEYIKKRFEETGINEYSDMKDFYKKRGEHLVPSHYVFFLFNENDEIVGFKYFYLNTETQYTKFYLTAIEPSYRRKGQARKMIEKALDFIIEKNISKIEVQLIKNNKLNIYMLQNLYVKLKADYLNLEFNIKYV